MNSATVLRVSKCVLMVLFLTINFINVTGHAQESKTILSNASIAEKIYLQLDKDIYTTGSTAWFKAIVSNAHTHKPTSLSTVLHVELIDGNKTIIEKKLIKINNGIGDGYFDLPETLVAGSYLIRAYTEWNKNFDSDFFFEKYIQVFSIYDRTTSDKKEVLQTQISEEEQSEIHSGINNNIDLQFLPESGELVHNLSSKIGFKALDTFGYGTPIEGIILDNENKQIAVFKSNSLGMGSFQLDSVNSNKTYHAKLKNESKIYPLPKVASIGNVISVSEKDKIITVNTASNYLKNDSISLNVSFRGAILHDFKAKLKNGNLKFLFSSNELPEGILVFKMIDNFNRTVAERLYFNKRLETNLNLNLSTNKSIYSKRELTNLHIETVNKTGEPVNANASVLIINRQELGVLQNTRDNIFSYFLVSSELKGEIENPGYYFNNNTPPSDLDALLLTQGWRQYKYSKPYEKISFKPETSLTVSGKVISKSSKDNGSHVDLTMMTFGKKEEFYTQTTDTLGKFRFELEDEYGGSLNILIQSTKKSGKKVEYNFNMDEKKSPFIAFNHQKSMRKSEPIIEKLVEKNIEHIKKIEGNFYLPPDNIALDEVLLTGRNLNAAQQKVTKRFGEPDRIIDGKDIQEKEQTWSYGLFSVLLFSFPDKIKIKRFSDGVLYARGMNDEITLVVIDGIPVREYEYSLIEGIPPSQVTSVEVIEHAKFFTGLFCDLFPMHCKDAPVWGNVIAIYTKAGTGIQGAFPRKPKGITNTEIPVFSESKTFYAPKYDKMTPENLEWPDLRSLIHWQPILKTDNSGKAKTSFYNADITGDMIVVVEAITENGVVGYQEYIYKVE